MSGLINYHLYNLIVYDGARDLAAHFGQDVNGMRIALLYLGVNDKQNFLTNVANAQSDPEYAPDKYRGKMCDEGVIEALKDCLRPIHDAKCLELSHASENSQLAIWGIHFD